jgi:hypothetical protein
MGNKKARIDISKLPPTFPLTEEEKSIGFFEALLFESEATERPPVNSVVLLTDSFRVTEFLAIELYDGMYTAIFERKTGKLYALRHGLEWRDLVGDGLFLSLMQKIEEAAEIAEECLHLLKPIEEKTQSAGGTHVHISKADVSSLSLILGKLQKIKEGVSR